LVDYINGDDFTAWPAFDTLADDLGIDRSTVIRAINAGRKAGLLERIYKVGKTRRGGTSNRYRFNLDLVAGSHWVSPQPSGRMVLDLVARQPPNLLKTISKIEKVMGSLKRRKWWARKM
jgi:DNA-binding transcriptional MocR family regulator